MGQKPADLGANGQDLVNFAKNLEHKCLMGLCVEERLDVIIVQRTCHKVNPIHRARQSFAVPLW